jgi:hypothetical protein
MADEERFKPIRIKDADSDVKRAAERANEDWTAPVFRPMYNKWWEYIRWFEGDQYGYIRGKKDATWFDVTDLLDREVKNVYNRILPMIRQQHGDLIFDSEFYTIAATQEAADRKSAAVASVIIEQSNYDRGFNKKQMEAKLLILLLGNCYWKEWWNKNLWALAYDEKKGATRVKGDVDYGIVNPFNFRPDPLAQSREEWRYCIEGKRVPVSAIENEFKLEKGTIPNEGYSAFEQDRMLRWGIEKPKEETAVRLEYWEFASSDNEKGRFIVQCGDWLLYSGPNPTPGAKQNYFHFKSAVPIIGTQFGQSMVGIGQAPQRQINRHYSMVDEHFQNFRAKGMIPFGSLRYGDEQAFKRMGGVDILSYNPRVGAPYWQNPPALPESSLGYSQMLEGEFEIETSVRKTSYGALPKYASRPSNSLFQSLKGQDSSVMAPGLVNMDEENLAAIRLRLEIAKEHYTEPRLIKSLGKGKIHAIRSFQGSDLRDSTDVMVVPGVDIFTSRKKREDIAMKFVEMRAVDAKKALEIMNFKGVEKWMQEDKVDEYQVNRHIEDMVATGKYIPADPSDNHEVCYKLFNDYRKSEEYEQLDKKHQDLIIRRLNDHKRFLLAAAKPQPPAEQSVVGPPGAITPTPVEPPGLVAPVGTMPAPGDGGGPPGEIPPEIQAAIAAQLAQGGTPQ